MPSPAAIPLQASDRDATRPAPARILLVGEPALRVVCPPLTDFGSPALRADCAVLTATLADFRATHGFGRAIAAPQIGLTRRLVALDLGHGASEVDPRVLCNPRIVERSAETFTLWDDCLSFPWLLVRVRRHTAVRLSYEDLEGRTHAWDVREPAESELLQHELDHLDGILALDRAEEPDAFIAREIWLRERSSLRAGDLVL